MEESEHLDLNQHQRQQLTHPLTGPLQHKQPPLLWRPPWLAPVPAFQPGRMWVTSNSKARQGDGPASWPHPILSHPSPPGLHLPSWSPRQIVGRTAAEGSVAGPLSSPLSVSSSSGSGIYSMQSTGAASGKDLTVRGEGRFREKIST